MLAKAPYQLRRFHPAAVPAPIGVVVPPTDTGPVEAANVTVDSSGGVPGGDVQEALQNLSDLIASIPVYPTVYR